MDFGLVDGFVSDNGGASFPDTNKTAKIYSSNGSGSADAHPQMLCFSSASPYHHQPSYGFARNAGNVQRGVLSGAGGPFTPSQWMELEHQALIYKYITANVTIPSYLLNPIRKAFESVRFSGFAGLTSNALGWGPFHLGFASTDPEPGRCRRTDGKKWRCSRDAVIDQKYCERHMNRGRHRSRKPVEGRSGQPATRNNGGKPTTATASSPPAASNAAVSSHPSGIPNVTRDDADRPHKKAKGLENDPHFSMYSEPSFGLVCSDSLLNPLNRISSLVNNKNSDSSEKLNDHGNNNKSNPLRQFMDEWPDETNLSISIPSDEKVTPSSPRHSRELEMGLAVGPRQGEGSWDPASWEGGPLGEALHTAGECKSTKQLNLIGAWDISSPRIASSPTGVLQMGPFGSLSSSPRAGLCNGLIGSGLMNPSLPSL